VALSRAVAVLFVGKIARGGENAFRRRRFTATIRENCWLRDDIDAVDVVIPNRLHYEVGRAVADVGAALVA